MLDGDDGNSRGDDEVVSVVTRAGTRGADKGDEQGVAVVDVNGVGVWGSSVGGSVAVAPWLELVWC